MTERSRLEHAVPSVDRPAGRRTPAMVRIGAVLFVVGLVFLLITVLPFFWGDHNRSVWLNVGSMLAPIGFVLAIVGAIRAGRAEQRATLDRIDASRGPGSR